MAVVQLRPEGAIYRGILQALAARAGLTNINETSTVAHIGGAVAKEIATAYYDLVSLARSIDLSTASGDQLDTLGAQTLAGVVPRLSARYALGTITFGRNVATASPIVIPAGVRVRNAVTGKSYTTTEAGTIAAGATISSPAVDARALEIGADSNATQGDVSVLETNIAGVDYVTSSAFTNGADTESDDEYRVRLYSAIASLPRCTEQAVAFAVLGVEDPDGSGKTIRFSSVFADPTTPGYAIVYVDDGTGNLADTENVGTLGLPAPVVPTSFTLAGTTVTLVATGAFPATAEARADLVGRHVLVQSATSPGNNGVFVVLTCPDVNTITYENASGVTEAGAGTFSIGELLTVGLTAGGSALGGEEFFNTALVPHVHGTTNIWRQRAGTWSLLVSGTDFFLKQSRGLIWFTSPLQAGDFIMLGYSYYVGVVAEAQKIVYGDPNDRLNYPGYAPVSADVTVRTPTLRPYSIVARLHLSYTGGSPIRPRAETLAEAAAAASAYGSTHAIGEDPIVTEIIRRLKVDGVYDVELLQPTNNINVSDSDLARAVLVDIR